MVGISSWAVHHNKDVFGPDVNDFRPGRWLDANEEQVRLMERLMLHVGGGKHLCLRIYKISVQEKRTR